MTQPQAGAVTGDFAPAQAPAKDTPADVRRRLRSIFSGSVGNLVEWYDWYVYSAFALYFAKAFFPKGDQTAQLLNTAAVFAVGFLARPVGGWLMGIYADRYGRKRALFFSVVLMCLGSLIIALTPSYATIGVAAPVLLVLARLLQGLSVGGEYGTSATYLSEVANKENRGFYSSFQYVTLIAGQLTALALLIVLQQFVLSPAQLEAWGWRIPFFIGALCALVAMRMRSHMEETESFTAAKQNKRRGTLAELAKHPRAVATVVGLTLGGTVAFYTYSIYMQKFLANTVGLTKDKATLVSGATLLLFAILQPIVGGLSDRIGRRPILIAFGVLGTLFTVPIMTGISQTTNVWMAFFLIMAALVIVSGYTSINAVVKAELFPAEVRALGVGLPYALTVSIFGGTAEYIALWLKQIGHEPLFYWYVTGTIFISLMVYVFMRDTRKHSRIEH
ncbi:MULTISPECIES: MFS transporter [Ralstonia]|uniref:Alpha-ketoglutarate permease n=1 Tax=Ralstonia mannitolilytica TaxID=105219 RepID=A0AAJ5D7T5_9RALS|nr:MULTISPECIES: MFS transporter [Ralstonia]AJW46836.1 alpha-ketoglutarate transporter [Ralstonia mannitolilytica]MBU9577130.1 MFS transporter [Ralstonia mannitolilytica]PLT17724.1 MFS transporter [Ralstonia mannitolilytica]QIF10183.1 MFS transporter [Ralstonia mannitolilytica]CAG2131124.1 Alpha-ketoglutarate permease [Ralstonia mannitolilytica]